MFTDAFQKCGTDETAKVIKRLDELWSGHGFRLNGAFMIKKGLSFYKDALYLDLTQADQHPSRSVQLVMGPGGYFICDGCIDHILAFNQNYPLVLDRHVVLDYVRFYFAHVVGSHGLTRIVDTVEDIDLEEEPTPSLRKSLSDKIIPLTLQASLETGGYQARGTIMIRRTLYTVVVDVSLDGIVTPHLGRVLADILPIHDKMIEN